MIIFEDKFMSLNQLSLYEKIIKHSDKLLLRTKNEENRRFLYHIKL